MTPIREPHVLFDLDGTLVDTRDAVTACYQSVFASHLDQPFPPDTLTGELFAMRPREVFAQVAPDRIEELYTAYQSAYDDASRLVRTFDGAADLIRALAASGRKPSLVTNKGRARTRTDLGVSGIDPGLFAAIVTAEDTEERKPKPAPILLGLDRAGGSADAAVYVGDGPQDILAARAAGMGCIAVSYGFYPVETLTALDPLAMVGSIAELAAALGQELERA
ncbi:MAG: serine phosphatase [Rhodobacteraceae bacterium]|nr:serine phosphatase [Paracoccaceae bacterium]MAY45310.1 serine phosphatase [Paracoccaceae bacterium]